MTGVRSVEVRRVLIACEFSGVVRDAFLALGYDAWSCDLLPTESPIGDHHFRHYCCDVRHVLDLGWDLMIAHPPCTHLAVSGARWFKGKEREQAEALDFVRELMAAPIQRIAIENPVSVISSKKPRTIPVAVVRDDVNDALNVIRTKGSDPNFCIGYVWAVLAGLLEKCGEQRPVAPWSEGK